MRNAAIPLAVLAIAITQASSPAQTRTVVHREVPAYISNPNSILNWWNRRGARKEVTFEYPTDYQVGQVYRLKRDVIVERGGTSGHVSQYWINTSHESDSAYMEKVKREAPKNRKPKPFRSQDYLEAGTRLQFEQIWLEGNYVTGVYVKPYALILDGPLQGKRICIHFITDHEHDKKTQLGRCHIKPDYLELATQ